MNWNEIKELKSKYQALREKARLAKTKKTMEKYRDKASELKRELSHELSTWNFENLDFSQFNIVAPVGGPYYLGNSSNFRLEKNLGGYLQVSFENDGTRYAGYLYWLDDKCGIDNMKYVV